MDTLVTKDNDKYEVFVGVTNLYFVSFLSVHLRRPEGFRNSHKHGQPWFPNVESFWAGIIDPKCNTHRVPQDSNAKLPYKVEKDYPSVIIGNHCYTNNNNGKEFLGSNNHCMMYHRCFDDEFTLIYTVYVHTN